MSNSAGEQRPTMLHRLELLGLLAAHHLILALPYPCLRGIAWFLGSVIYYCDQRGRSTALENLRCAFPDRYTEKERRRIARLSYVTFGRTMLELFWSPRLTEEFVDKHVTHSGRDTDVACNDPKRSAIYTCLHFSNFEWLGQICAYKIEKGPVIAQNFKNPLLSPLFVKLRSSTGLFPIPQERAVIRMLKLLKSGHKFGMLCDLSLDPKEGGVPILTFDNLRLSATPAHAVLAQKTDAVVVPIGIHPKPHGGYNVHHHLPITNCAEMSIVEIAQKCWDALEKDIRKSPECWLWSYKHWRFKPSDDTASKYPSYSNHAKRFDKAIQEASKPDSSMTKKK